MASSADFTATFSNYPMPDGQDPNNVFHSSLYHHLAQTQLLRRMKPLLDAPRASTTTLTHLEGKRFRAELRNDLGELIQEKEIQLVFVDGYLHSRRKWSVVPYIVVNGFANMVHALAIDSDGSLHLFHCSYSAGGFFLFLGDSRNANKFVYTRTIEQPD